MGGKFPASLSVFTATGRQDQPWRLSAVQATNPAAAPSWSVRPSFPPPSSTYTPTAGGQNYPACSSFGRSQQMENSSQRPAMKNLDSAEASRHRYIGAERRTETASEQPRFCKMDISARPSVIQSMRNPPPYKLQRMSRYPETLVGNFENKSPRKSEANLVSESICDDRETEIILKYIHKKFSKYQHIQTKLLV